MMCYVMLLFGLSSPSSYVEREERAQICKDMSLSYTESYNKLHHTLSSLPPTLTI